MLKIRLQRIGRKNVPVFRLVLTDSKNSTKSGRFQEILGSYDPVHKTKEINVERVKYWLGQGVQPTDTLHNMFVREKIIEGKMKNVLPKKSPIKKEEPEGEKKAEPAVEAPAPTEAISETPKSEEPVKEESVVSTEEVKKEEASA